MTFILEVEYLSGVCYAATGPGDAAPDWPPQPDRVFSALVATWAARGQGTREREALEWLEALPPPQIIYSTANARTAAIAFVPPNDPRSDRQKNAKGVVPSLRNRQPRRFPSARPLDPVVRFVWWHAQPGTDALGALNELARDTAYVGHSTSLTRCRFLRAEPPSTPAADPKRRVYAGRLAELRRTFDDGRRPLPGDPVRMKEATPVPVASIFSNQWLVLEHVKGVMPDVRGCAYVARVIRDALLSGYRAIGMADSIPEEVSGHTSEGNPSQAPHIAIIPLAFVGFPHADGHVIGFALVPPRGSMILNDHNFRRVLRASAPLEEKLGRRILALKTKNGTLPGDAFSIAFSPTFEATRTSMDPALYVRGSRVFASVTPIVLDRHLKEEGSAREREIEIQIETACRNTGLPAPERVIADKHSAFEGAVSTYPSGKSPRWLNWRLPRSVASRQLTHAILYFSEEIEGPVVLGAGRYHGLGLCRPLAQDRS